MRENICTIPVNEVFEVQDGCPVCRMRDIIEAKYIDYITGAAMMEPDVRVMTNKTGFCERHYNQMLALGRQRLPICLMLETHIQHIQEDLLAAPDKGSIKKLEELEGTCFVCDAIETHLARALDTVYRSYKNEPEFRALFDGQPQLCLPHYRRLVAEGKKTVGALYKQFAQSANRQAKSWCDSVYSDMKGFEDAFDHRNAGKPMPEKSRDAIERAIQFITSRDPKNAKNNLN